MAEQVINNAIVLGCAALVFWLISLAINKVSFVDSIWGGAMAMLAFASFVQLSAPGALAWLIMLMAVIWGARLFYHLLTRFLRDGEDPRYVRILAEDRAKGRWWIAVLLRVWLLQSLLLFAVSSPAHVGILASGDMPIPMLGWIGFALWLVGMIFETVGDAQLARFKAEPANKGKVMDEGLWRYTRHPNYFGDACVWWGIWLACAAAGWDYALYTAVGPIFLTFTLVKWSGAAMTERGMQKKYGDAFADYVRRTSSFIPLPPRNS